MSRHKLVERGIALGTALVTVLGLAACSSGGSSAESSASGSQGTKAVTFWGGWTDSVQVKQLQQQADKFNESQSEYKVTYVPQETLEQKLLTGLASGQVPDVVLWDRTNTPVYVSKGALTPIDDLVSRDNVDTGQYYSEALQEMTVSDQLYGLPVTVDVRALFYNKKLLDDAGVSVPTTWEELEEVAPKVTEVENGKTTVSGFMVNDTGLFSMYLKQAGGTMLNADGTATAFNNEHGLAVLDLWKNLLDNKVYQPGFGEGVDAFAEGKAAMMYDGPWDLAKYDAVDGLDYGVAEPLSGPDGDKGANMGGFALAMPQGAKDSEGAWAFMKWWAANTQNSVDFGKISGNIPAIKAAANDEYFTSDEHYAAIIKTLDYATIRPTVPGYPDMESKALVPALQKFMAGELTAQQALDQGQSQGDEVLKSSSN